MFAIAYISRYNLYCILLSLYLYYVLVFFFHLFPVKKKSDHRLSSFYFIANFKRKIARVHPKDVMRYRRRGQSICQPPLPKGYLYSSESTHLFSMAGTVAGTCCCCLVHGKLSYSLFTYPQRSALKIFGVKWILSTILLPPAPLLENNLLSTLARKYKQRHILLFAVYIINTRQPGWVLNIRNARKSESVVEFLHNPVCWPLESILSSVRITKWSGRKQEWHLVYLLKNLTAYSHTVYKLHGFVFFVF